MFKIGRKLTYLEPQHNTNTISRDIYKSLSAELCKKFPIDEYRDNMAHYETKLVVDSFNSYNNKLDELKMLLNNVDCEETRESIFNLFKLEDVSDV